MKKRMIALLSMSALVAAMAVAAPALSGTRICLLNHYQWNEGGAVMSVSPADPGT